MKNSSFPFAMAMILLFTSQISLTAQKKATWKGGFPGRSADWNCPANWKEGNVPNEFSNVVIPDVSSGSRVWPIVYGSVEPINALTLCSGASLRIEKSGVLEVIFLAETIGASSILTKGTLKVPTDNPYLKIRYEWPGGNFAER